VLRRPSVATVLLLGGMVVFHATGLLDLALTTHPGHFVMVVVTLLVGVLWSSAIIGSFAASRDGAVPRSALVCLCIVVVGGFVSAWWLSRGTSLLAGDIFQQLEVGWQGGVAADQARAGAVALFITVPVCVTLAAVLVTVAMRAEPPDRP
jgi:cytochrome c oxidase assembly factor CtaG